MKRLNRTGSPGRPWDEKKLEAFLLDEANREAAGDENFDFCVWDLTLPSSESVRPPKEGETKATFIQGKEEKPTKKTKREKRVKELEEYARDTAEGIISNKSLFVKEDFKSRDAFLDACWEEVDGMGRWAFVDAESEDNGMRMDDVMSEVFQAEADRRFKGK